MKTLEINQIPAEILHRFNSNRFVLITTEALNDTVWGTATFDPNELQVVEGLDNLVELRKSEKVYSITTSIISLDQNAIDEATKGLENSLRIADELYALLRRSPKVYLVYVVTHFNYKPMGDLTVFIGGDCYRREEIKDLETVFRRTNELAKAMIRKAVMIFPKIPTLHGGKKGEWIILNVKGEKIEELSEEAIVALGTLIIPKGIKFLNDYKEKNAREKGIFEQYSGTFPEKNFIRPDTASPDVVSGKNWERMCAVWRTRNVDMSYITCLPSTLRGPIQPSAYPTAYGVVATATKLIQHYFKDKKELKDIRFLLEALGGVGNTTVEALKKKGFDPRNITGFDRDLSTCNEAIHQYGIKALNTTAEDFYRKLKDDPQEYDVWINNGEGGNTTPEQVESLLARNVKIFCGGANDFLKRSNNMDDPNDDSLRQVSLRKIFDAGAWAWPDEAASGGGWTLAVIDVLTRSKGEDSGTLAVIEQILKIIKSRNEELVEDVVGGLQNEGKATGEAIWTRVNQIINDRVENTIKEDFLPNEIAAQADVTRWTLT